MTVTIEGIDDTFMVGIDDLHHVQNAVDLRDLAEEVMDDWQVRQMSLKRLASLVMGIDVHKPRRVQTSCWDNEYLSYAQIMYACVDAFLSFEIGRRLTNGYF